MTTALTPEEQAKFDSMLAEMRADDEARAAFFTARTAYAMALGYGTATRKARLELEALKERAGF